MIFFFFFSNDFLFCRTILSATLTFGFLIFFSGPPREGQSRFDRKGSAIVQIHNVQMYKYIANLLQLQCSTFLKWNTTKGRGPKKGEIMVYYHTPLDPPRMVFPRKIIVAILGPFWPFLRRQKSSMIISPSSATPFWTPSPRHISLKD